MTSDDGKAATFSAICACMGLVGKDPYCPCEMRRRGLKSDSEWTPEDIARLEAALSDAFGRKSQPFFSRDYKTDDPAND